MAAKVDGIERHFEQHEICANAGPQTGGSEADLEQREVRLPGFATGPSALSPVAELQVGPTSRGFLLEFDVLNVNVR